MIKHRNENFVLNPLTYTSRVPVVLAQTHSLITTTGHRLLLPRTSRIRNRRTVATDSVIPDIYLWFIPATDTPPHNLTAKSRLPP
uniref:Uncharacterized protein n=1 Tax=Helianthus annuus TaxID=4232 RepID=A0A251SEB2_HELAN